LAASWPGAAVMDIKRSMNSGKLTPRFPEPVFRTRIQQFSGGCLFPFPKGFDHPVQVVIVLLGMFPPMKLDFFHDGVFNHRDFLKTYGN
jgi:hypothetical protein